MSDSDEFEYESDDDPYGGAEEEAWNIRSASLNFLAFSVSWSGLNFQDGDEEAIQIENTFYEAEGVPSPIQWTCFFFANFDLLLEADDNKQNFPEQALDLPCC